MCPNLHTNLELEPMSELASETLKKVIVILGDKSRAATKSEDAMRFAQAALNMAHAFITVKGSER